MSFENIAGKGENAGNKDINHHFRNYEFVKAFNLDQTQILSFGKELSTLFIDNCSRVSCLKKTIVIKYSLNFLNMEDSYLFYPETNRYNTMMSIKYCNINWEVKRVEYFVFSNSVSSFLVYFSHRPYPTQLHKIYTCCSVYRTFNLPKTFICKRTVIFESQQYDYKCNAL